MSEVLTDAQLLEFLKTGETTAFNTYHEEHPEQAISLSGANLHKKDLSGADLSKVSLLDTILIEADLSGTHLYKTDLSGANLRGADLSGANLFKADLSKANLTGVELADALNIEHAHFAGATMSRDSLGALLDRIQKSITVTD